MTPVKIADRLIENETDGELLVLAMGTGVFHSMKPVALEVWRLIDGSRDIEAIVATLLQRFDVAPETCRTDVERYLNQLRAAGLVRFA